MNKQSYQIQSDYFCKCGKPIKMNLFSKKIAKTFFATGVTESQSESQPNMYHEEKGLMQDCQCITKLPA